jgi:hypothetical protein
MHPKSVPSTFLLGVAQPQELMMEATDSPDKQIVGANGIPRGYMSFPQGPPLHLLRQAWNQIDCYWASLNSLDGFLSNVAMLTLKSMQKNLTFCAHNQIPGSIYT